MKIFYLLFLFVALSCSKSKDDKTCWECDRPPSGSYSGTSVEICADGSQAPTTHTDSQGNSYGVSNCVKK